MDASVNVKKKLAIIGASYLQDPLIRTAKAMGIETHVFAWAANDVGEKSADHFYPISIIQKEEILEKCRELEVDGVCSIASDLAVMTVNYVAFHMGLTGNSMESSECSTNKALMRETFYKNADPSPVSYHVQKDEIKEIKNLDLKYPLIVKPVDRSGSRGVSKIINDTELEKALDLAFDNGFKKEAVVEEYVEGKEYSVECISYKGQHRLLAVTEKYTTGFPHYIETGHIEPTELSDEMIERVKNTVFHALDSLKIEYGASHSEIKINDKQIMIVEIGARMGGDLIGSSLVPISTGVDYVRSVIQVALGKAPEVNTEGKCRSCAIRFIINSNDLEIYRKLTNEHPEYIVSSDVPDTVEGIVTNSSDRKGFFVFAADSRSELTPYLD